LLKTRFYEKNKKRKKMLNKKRSWPINETNKTKWKISQCLNN